MTVTPTEERDLKIALVRKVCDAICETVDEAYKLEPMIGAPGGHLYAAMMGHMSVHTFESIMSGLVAAGRLRKSGNCYFPA